MVMTPVSTSLDDQYKYFYHDFQGDDEGHRSEMLNDINEGMGDDPDSFGYQHIVDRGPCGCWTILRQRENMDWTPHKVVDWTSVKPDENELKMIEEERANAYAACCINKDILMDHYTLDEDEMFEGDDDVTVNDMDYRRHLGRPEWHNVKDLGCCNHQIGHYVQDDFDYWNKDFTSDGCCASIACYNCLFSLAGIAPIILIILLCRWRKDKFSLCGLNPWANGNRCCDQLDLSDAHKILKSDRDFIKNLGGGTNHFNPVNHRISRANAIQSNNSPYTNNLFGMMK